MPPLLRTLCFVVKIKVDVVGGNDQEQILMHVTLELLDRAGYDIGCLSRFVPG